MGMNGYTRREPDPRGEASANGTKTWGPRVLDGAAARQRTARVHLAVSLQLRDAAMARTLSDACGRCPRWLAGGAPCGG